MPDIIAIDAEIEALYAQLSKIGDQIWAICSPYDGYSADQLSALADRVLAAAQDARQLQASQDELYSQIDALYAARGSAVQDDTGYEGALTA